jgi:hypothetical protein
MMAVSVLLIGSTTAAAAEADREEWEGTYVYDAANSDDIDAAIDNVVEEMSWWKRPFARSRLQDTNEAYQRVVISTEPDRVGIAVNRRGYIWTGDQGKGVQWTNAEGDEFTVSTVWRDGKLLRMFVGDDGRRINTWELSDDGRTLRMHAEVKSSQLPEPLTYTLVYRLKTEEPRP